MVDQSDELTLYINVLLMVHAISRLANLRGVWGYAPPENFELSKWILTFEATSGHTIALNQEHFDHACGTNLRAAA